MKIDIKWSGDTYLACNNRKILEGLTKRSVTAGQL